MSWLSPCPTWSYAKTAIPLEANFSKAVARGATQAFRRRQGAGRAQESRLDVGDAGRVIDAVARKAQGELTCLVSIAVFPEAVHEDEHRASLPGGHPVLRPDAGGEGSSLSECPTKHTGEDKNQGSHLRVELELPGVLELPDSTRRGHVCSCAGERPRGRECPKLSSGHFLFWPWPFPLDSSVLSWRGATSPEPRAIRSRERVPCVSSRAETSPVH